MVMKMNYGLRNPKTELLIHADIIEQSALDQINLIIEHPAIHGLVAIQADCHSGIGAVIGFTGKFRGAVIPNIVGYDIGCGVMAYPMLDEDIMVLKSDFMEFDNYVRKNIPLGFHSRNGNDKFYHDIIPESADDIIKFNKKIEEEFFDHYNVRTKSHPRNQLGTLGGGNHFIEVAESDDGKGFLMVHSGSRNLGTKVASYFQDMAKSICKAMMVDIPRELEYLPMKYGGHEYMKWLHITQRYAKYNREIMMRLMLRYFGRDFERENAIESVHNYISTRDNVIRKGAISAHKGERVIIPFNQAEGSIIGVGRGVKSYLCSAPHGAGRVFGRKEMDRRLARGDVTMVQFEDSMKHVFSTSVKKRTIDESKFAYKPIEKVMKHIEETVEVQLRIKPIYNLKDDTKKRVYGKGKK